jgi:glycosyltransferase involved in cell wall biosynthesis
VISSINSISIIMATYNGEQFLEQQLESIFNQTLKPFEVIICDDASTDSTIAILKSFSKKLPIKIFKNSENTGYIKNFERAVLKARGKYLAFCDQDDIWHPEKLQILFDNIGNNTLIYSESNLISETGSPLHMTLSKKLKSNFISSSSPLNFLYNNSVSAHSILVKTEIRQAIIPFPRHLYFDAWIAANAAALNGVKFLKFPLVDYRQHSQNVLSRNEKKKKSIVQSIQKKTEKKSKEHLLQTKIIKELLKAPELKEKEKEILQQLLKGHKKFSTSWFNISLCTVMLTHRKTLFAITRRNSFSLAIKKSIGKKLYQIFPFL